MQYISHWRTFVRCDNTATVDVKFISAGNANYYIYQRIQAAQLMQVYSFRFLPALKCFKYIFSTANALSQPTPILAPFDL